MRAGLARRSEAAHTEALGPAVLLGLIGAGIQRSRTPGMHEREGAELGLRLVYNLIDLDALGLAADSLPELVLGARRLGFTGLNVTYPCKQAVLPLLDGLSPDAAALGAVNTVALTGRRAVGHNTDWSGFAAAFRHEMAGVALGRVVVIGAGGAGAAVTYALLTLGAAELLVHDTAPGRAEALAAQLSTRFGAGRVVATPDVGHALSRAEGLVNATPVGMTGHPGTAVPDALLRPDLWVADVVYVPLETALLRTARARGCRTMGGGAMAVFQAVEAFRLFTGRSPDAERMLAHFHRM
jgi:shikimate dehydrogenase